MTTYEYLGITITQLREYGAIVAESYISHRGETVIAWQLNDDDSKGKHYFATVKRYDTESGYISAAVFPKLPAGNYGLSFPKKNPDPAKENIWRKTTVFPGIVEEIKV